jgi:tRNA(Ile2) C34 agmatinyltransferase TiaS
VDAVSASWIQFAVAVLVLAAGWQYLRRRYQKCPHCERIVPRAVRGWLRCKRCGRQYHRSVHFHR